MNRLSENPITPQQCQNHYYSIAQYASRTHSKQGNVKSVKELVLDVDFGSIGHQRSQFSIEEEASAYIRTLPIPTVIIMSGGGFQLHYRLDGGAEKHDFMLAMQMLTEVWQIDHCTSCEHLYRLPFSYNCKNVDHIRPVQIIDAHDLGYSLEDFKNLIPKDFVFHAQKEKQIHQRTVRAIIDSPKGMDRSGTAFSIMLRALGEYPNISDKTVESIVKKYSNIYAHYANDNELRKDIRRAREKFHIDTIQPILPTESVDISNMDLNCIE